ncbi:MAG: hypothetical protein OXG62_09990 [Nitrospinae bacterium]|nr:hypothetical protein [Nitrospinota bacterium]
MTKRNPSKAARAIVLGGPALALLFTLYVLVSGSGARLLFTVWFWAVLWTFLTALAGAVWRAFQGDCSAFTGYELPEGDGDRFDWATRTGRYAWRRDDEERELHVHDDYPGHGPIT